MKIGITCWALVLGFGLAGAAMAQDYAGKTIVRVDLQGLTRVSDQLVRSQLETQPEQAYSSAVTSRDLRRLYELGHFNTIKIDVSESGAGVVVAFVFEEKRVIDEIKILGAEKIRARALRGVLTWREGDAFVAEAYPEQLEAIRALYRAKGFPNAAVDILVEDLAPGRVRVTYTIHENGKARVADIRFEGNEVLSSRALRRTMKTKPRLWWLPFIGGKYDETVFEDDLKNIVDKYGDYGRLEAAITGTNFDFSPSGKRMDIGIAVGEGPEYRVGTLEIEGNRVYDEDEILSIVQVQSGDVHNKSQVQADANLVAKGYSDSGYVESDVYPLVTMNREDKTTHIVYRIAEGALKYIRELKVAGNNVTKDEVIRRNIALEPGDRFDGSAIRYSERSLENLRYFEGAPRFTIEPIPDSDLYSNLLVDVEEARTNEFGFGGGFSTDEGVSGFLQLNMRNFDIMNWPKFSGGGQLLNARISLGDVTDQYSISFTDPEIAGYPLAFGFDLYNTRSRVDAGGGDYTQEQNGAALRFGKVLSPHVRTRMALRATDSEISNVPTFAIPELRRLWRDEGSTNSIIWGISRSTLDSPSDATQGGRFELEIELAGAGDHEFYKFDADSTWYRALGQEKRWIASYRSRIGWVNDYGDPGFVSLSDRYFLGGTTTVRGYKARDIGPQLYRFGFFGERYRTGGELRLVNNLELKYKLTEQVRFYTFIDGGGLWSTAGDFDYGDMKYGAGIGLGIDIPRMGPIRIDYGIPLNPDDDQGSGRLHLQGAALF